MLNAQQIANVLSVLDQVHNLTMAQAKDPLTVGRLSAEAFIAAMPLKFALERLGVDLRSDEEISA